MAYIGNQPYQVAFVTDTFNGNGSTTAFTMSVAPANTASVLVAVSGVLQDPSTYSVSGTTLTFSAAPPSGTGNISCRYLGIPASGVTTTAYRTVTEFTATASQTTFTPPSYTVGFINVYRNGVLLGSADYTATNGTTVVLATGAAVNDLVTVESFLVSSVLNAIPATAGSVGSTYLADASVTRAKMGYAGAVLQVVQTQYNTKSSTTSTSWATIYSASITPTSTSSKVLVAVSFSGSHTDNYSGLVRVLRDSTAIGGGAGGGSYESNVWFNIRNTSNYFINTFDASYLDSPSTTSAITYNVQWIATGGIAFYINRTVNDSGTQAYDSPTASSITLMEIAG